MTLDNTLDSPTDFATTAFQSCPTVPKTFLNKDHCVPRETCSSISYASQYFTLSESVVQQFYELDGLYVYAVKVVVVRCGRHGDIRRAAACGAARGRRRERERERERERARARTARPTRTLIPRFGSLLHLTPPLDLDVITRLLDAAAVRFD